MRLLHTSDWHLGRAFHGVDLLAAQGRFLDHLVEVVRAERVDAVVVAGDVYDRALPPVDAVRLLDDALDRLHDAGAQVVLSSGNHDSPQRLGFGARRAERAGLHVRTAVRDLARPALLGDAHGPVAVYALPYLEPATAAEALEAEAPTHEHVLRSALARVRADLARHAGARSVVAAHAFVTGAAPSDSERDIRVGGVGAVPRSLLAGFDYVALGHLHGPQRLAETVRYSGSPLPYSFSEARQRKGSWLVDLGPAGVATVERVPAPVHRPLATLRGRLADLLADPAHAPAEAAFCQVVLTDAERPAAPMDRLRARFPHTVHLTFEPQGAATSRGSYVERVTGLDDEQVCCAFLDDVRGRPASGPERALLRSALEHVRREQALA
jgi:exonuclease SbcD